MATPTAASAESMTYRSAKSGAQASASALMRSQAPSLASAWYPKTTGPRRHPTEALVGANQGPWVGRARAVAMR